MIDFFNHIFKKLTLLNWIFSDNLFYNLRIPFANTLRVYHLGGTHSGCGKKFCSGLNHIFAGKYGPKTLGLFHTEVELKNERPDFFLEVC